MDELAAFRALVMSDTALQDRLSAFTDISEFAASAATVAREHRIALSPDTIVTAAPPDPAGTRLLLPTPANTTHWPAPHWLPVNISLTGMPMVDWAHFGAAPFTAALDQPALRAALGRPFNRMFRPRLTLDDFVTQTEPGAAPSGFIFHMSRCGSTLAARMLGALADSVTVSEIRPVNDAVLYAHTAPNLTLDQRIALVKAIVAASGRRAKRHYFVRFEAWHALALPLLRRAFPHTPFVFLMREPVEVLVSQMRAGGTHLLSGTMPRVWDIENSERMDQAELTARALGRICEVAAGNLAGGIAIDYQGMPGAVETQILPHFGITPDATTRAAMSAIVAANAKMPGRAFTPDTADKQLRASDALRELAEARVGDAYRRLQ